MPTYTDPGFGRYLRTQAGLLAAYRDRTGAHLADMPRLVEGWRTKGNSPGRDELSPAEVEAWLRDQPGTDDQDMADFRAFSAIWISDGA